MPLAGLNPNELLRFEQLEAVWNQARMGICDDSTAQRKQDFGVVTEPSRPPRTPPTPEEVDAIRTAKASGESVSSIAERFETSEHGLAVHEGYLLDGAHDLGSQTGIFLQSACQSVNFSL